MFVKLHILEYPRALRLANCTLLLILSRMPFVIRDSIKLTIPLQCALTVLANFKKAGILSFSTSAHHKVKKSSADFLVGIDHRSLNNSAPSKNLLVRNGRDG